MKYDDLKKRLEAGLLDYGVLAGVFNVIECFLFVFGTIRIEGVYVIAITMFPQAMLVSMLSNQQELSPYFELYIMMFIIETIYYTIMDGLTAKGSLGRRASQTVIRCLEDTEKRPNIFKIFLRSFIKTFSKYLCLLPCLTIFLTDQKQALHDIVAGTIVVDKPPEEK